MKKVVKYCFCVLSLLIANRAQPQVGVVSDPVLQFLTESQTAELIAGFVETVEKYTEMINKIREQIDKVVEVKNELQKTYDYHKKNYDKMKRLTEGMKDFTLEGFIYFAEKSIGRSLNPADYLPDIDNDEYRKFKRSLSYDPGSDLSSDAKYAYSYLAALPSSHAMMDLILWKNAYRQNKLRNEMSAMHSRRMIDSIARTIMDKVMNDTTLVLTDGERIAAIQLAQRLLADNDAARATELESVGEELDRKVIEAAVIEKKRNTANSIYAYINVISTRWNANKGFSLAKHAKKRTKKAKPVIIDTGVQFNR
jgi:hypothetical protein